MITIHFCVQQVEVEILPNTVDLVKKYSMGMHCLTLTTDTPQKLKRIMILSVLSKI